MKIKHILSFLQELKCEFIQCCNLILIVKLIIKDVSDIVIVDNGYCITSVCFVVFGNGSITPLKMTEKHYIYMCVCACVCVCARACV